MRRCDVRTQAFADLGWQGNGPVFTGIPFLLGDFAENGTCATVGFRRAWVVVGVPILHAGERQFKQSAGDGVALGNEADDGRRVIGVFPFNQPGGREESQMMID